MIGVLADAAQCKKLGKVLRRAYPDTHRVTVVDGVASDSPEVQSLPLCWLDQVLPGEGISLLYVPPVSCPGSIETFQDIVAHLRAPDGCPWDRKQTHRSLRQGFQEEAYEVLDALDRGDTELLKEELGDILLHVLLQAQIASELGEFRMSDVVCHVHTKIVHRHPHVFGGLTVRSVDEVLINWEELKEREKEAGGEAPSSLEGISPTMPALARAQSIQRHVDRMAVVSAEVDVLVTQIAAGLSGLSTGADSAEREALLGDLLFDLTNLARRLDIDAESALREANARFERRYRELESTLR